jgi:uncharacterized protein (TIGR01777 family)
MKTILITGGTGLIGEKISKLLLQRGYKVSILTRSTNMKDDSIKYFQWDIKNEMIEEGAFENINTIIHLSGSNIGEKRWTSKRKIEIYNSRINSTKFLLAYIKKNNITINHFISASAIGYYGTNTSEKIFSEGCKSGNDFLANTCLNWEKEVLKFQEFGVKTTILRTGIVLSLNGGALKKMVIPARVGLNAALGKGIQYMPWIHIKDLACMYLELIGKEKQGIFNAVSSDYCTNFEFAKTLSKVLKKPFLLPNIPSFILKLLLGEMAVIALEGSRVNNDKIKNIGFQFEFEKLKPALKNILLNK